MSSYIIYSANNNFGKDFNLMICSELEWQYLSCSDAGNCLKNNIYTGVN